MEDLRKMMQMAIRDGILPQYKTQFEFEADYDLHNIKYYEWLKENDQSDDGYFTFRMYLNKLNNDILPVNEVILKKEKKNFLSDKSNLELWRIIISVTLFMIGIGFAAGYKWNIIISWWHETHP